MRNWLHSKPHKRKREAIFWTTFHLIGQARECERHCSACYPCFGSKKANPLSLSSFPHRLEWYSVAWLYVVSYDLYFAGGDGPLAQAWKGEAL